jgi:hypothetical protein
MGVIRDWDWMVNIATGLTDEEELDMAQRLDCVTITPHETGVFISVKRGSEHENHCRGNLGDALDLAHELLRPVTTDDGAPYQQKPNGE